jgi:hypothetical protein
MLNNMRPFTNCRELERSKLWIGVFFGKLIVVQKVKKFHNLYEPTCLLLCSQEYALHAYCEPDESTPHPPIQYTSSYPIHILLSSPLPPIQSTSSYPIFLRSIIYTWVFRMVFSQFSRTCVYCVFAYFILIDVLIMFNGECNLWSSHRVIFSSNLPLHPAQA